MISIEQLTFSYNEKQVLQNVSLNMEPGLVHGILGSNGSGKTTLLNLMAGKLTSQKGQILWQGELLGYQSLAYLEAGTHFYPLLTGREFLKIYQFRNPSFNISDWNEVFSLPLGDLIETYSAGMKKKLAFMAVLCQDKPIILLDEPFNNLDIDTNQLLKKLLKALAKKGKLILLTSHVLDILTNVTDYIHVLDGGLIAQTVPKTGFKDWKSSYKARETNSLLKKANKLI